MLKEKIDRLRANRSILLYILFGGILLAVCLYLKEILHGADILLGVIMPVAIGFVFAFILNVLMRFLENRLLNKLEARFPRFSALKRPCAIVITFIVVLGVLSLFFVIVLPQFVVSLSALARRLPGYVRDFTVWLNGVLIFYNLDSVALTDLAEYAADFMQSLSDTLKSAVTDIFGFTVGLANGLINVVFGIIFAVYMLAGKEKLCASVSRFSKCFFSEASDKKLRNVASIANETCSNFIQGQCLDALCLGILSFLVLSVMRMPYPLVIAVTLAIMNLIPVVGPWLGSIPCVVITFVISPWKALILVITIIVLQEIENKLIYPKIVGGRVGLDGIWVLAGVVCGGELGGLLGIILGVPILAVVGKLLSEKMAKIETDTESL